MSGHQSGAWPSLSIYPSNTHPALYHQEEEEPREVRKDGGELCEHGEPQQVDVRGRGRLQPRGRDQAHVGVPIDRPVAGVCYGETDQAGCGGCG